MESYDVAVIGAGLAGLHCARSLAERGLRVTLVDRKESPAEAVHTTGIFVRRTLEDYALPEDCLGAPVRHVRLYSPARRTLDLESAHDEFRLGRMGPLYLDFLAAGERAGVVWSPATRYLGLEREPNRNVLLLRSARGGGVRRIAARYVVGADGARSRVARDLGLDENREWIVGVEDVWRNAPVPGPPSFHCFLDPVFAPGYLAWVVSDGEETHIGVGGYAARFEPVRALEAFAGSVSGLVDLTRAERGERRGGRIPVGGVLRHIANGRGLLTGDAAGAVSPLTAGGLDPCLRLSSLAAAVIPAFLERGDQRALAPYSGARFRSRFISRLWMRRALASLHSPAPLELAHAALRFPFLTGLARHVFFGRGSFPDVNPASRLELPTKTAEEGI